MIGISVIVGQIMENPTPNLIMKGRPAFNHTAHKALWNWLADHPDASKEDWPGWQEVEDTPAQLCYACQYTHDLRLWEVYTLRCWPIPDREFSVVDCERCPLIWDATENSRSSCFVFYADWRRSCLPDAARAIAARRIADAPLRSGVEVI